MKTKFNGILTLLLALVVQISFAQTKTISGTVSDSSGPLPGVSVIVKGTTSGAETDFDGNYTLNAKEGDVLTFRYLGYKTTSKTIGASSTLNVTLEEGGEILDEVVVTAFGIKREEKALGYSVQSIKGEAMTEARESNITNAISGKVAGVQVTGTSGSVGASSRIVLRGNSSITGNNEPLYVVDGVPINNSTFGSAGSGGGVDLPNGASDINPDDIESLTVLKGPNAAALYGLRAGNGVIVITTKRGNPNKKFGVSINTNITFSNPLLLPDYQNSYGQGGDTNHFEYVDGASGGVGDGVDESWGPALDAGLSFVQWDSQLTNNGNPTPWISHPDNVKDFLNTGVNISNNVSITSGAFRLSIGNSEEKGMVPFTELKKVSVGVSGRLDIGDKIQAGVSLNYFNTDSDNIPISGYNNENPFQQFIWSARQVNFTDLRDWRNFPNAPDGTAAAGTPLNWNHNFQNNPYWVLETNTNTLEKDRIIGNVDLTSQLTDDLTLSTKLGLDSFNQRTTNRQAVGSNNAQNGSYTERIRRFEEINASFLLSYNKSLTEDFGLSLSVGGNHMNRTLDNVRGSLPNLELPNLYSLSNLQTGSTAVLSNYHTDQQINSFYGYGQFSYKEMLFLDFTGRKDWSSILPIQNNSFFYPSVTASVLLSDVFEGLKENNVNFLKLRGGWSKVGSTGALGAYSLNQTFGLSNSGFGNQASVPNTQYNPNLKAETVTGVEFGIDAKMFNNRLRFSATYYDQESNDLLVPIQVSAATGFTNVWVADISWTGGTGSYVFHYTAFGATNTMMGTSTSAMASMTGLQPLTSYNFDVAEVCAAGDTSLRMNYQFTTDSCSAINVGNPNYNIDSISATFADITFTWAGAAGYTSYFINFGDGTNGSGTGASQTHTYTANGQYTAVLKLYGDCDTTSQQIFVSIQGIGLEEHSDLSALLVYPNPTQGLLAINGTLDQASPVAVRIVNYLGQVINVDTFEAQAGGFEKTYDLSAAASGTYVIEIETAKGLLQKTVVVRH